MVRIFNRIIGIADDITAVERIVAHEIFHLTLCPIAITRRLSVVFIFIINERDELHRGIITRRTPRVEESITARCGIIIHPDVYRLFDLYPEIGVFIFTAPLCRAVHVLEVEFRVFKVNFTENCDCPVPHIIPAKCPARRRVIVDEWHREVQIFNITRCPIEPRRRPNVVVFPIIRVIIILRSVGVVG